MEISNRTTYVCGICNTNPDQLSHHIAHINSQTHKERKLICEHEICKYVLEFVFLKDHDYWNIYIQDEYLEERMRTPDIPILEDWVIIKSLEVEKKYKLSNPYQVDWWINKYKEITNKSCDMNDKIDRILFLNWKLKYLITQAETIQRTVRRLRNFDEEIINKINNNEITSSELLNKLTNEVCFNVGTECVHIENDVNSNSTLNKHKTCNINQTYLCYILYQKFKGSVICKDIEIETIQLGESRKSKRLMWFIIGENSTHDQIGKISVMFKQYIKDILTTTSLDEEKKNKLVNLLRPTPSGILKLRELFKEK